MSEELIAPYPPEDFDQFWQETVSEARAIPLDYRRERSSYPVREGFEIETIAFRGAGGKPYYGWICYPSGARRLHGFLWIPPYGRESVLPNEYGTREGYVSFSFNFHGEEPFHQEKYVPARGYFPEGASEPKTWIFREMFITAVVAARVFQAQSEVDENRIGSMGISQGAGLSIWLGAWMPTIIKAVCADLPFLGGLPYLLDGQIYRYPLKELADFMENVPLGRERLFHTLSYFDTINQATRCQVPTLVTLGLKDPAVKPIQARSIFAALPGEKNLIEYDWGHDYYPAMVENNADWLTRHLG
ncbi:MAG: acetylxylan esterase [Armatimonadetes bacterium]|nr:acetylxylan esterase [Armatimonadota bacterium]